MNILIRDTYEEMSKVGAEIIASFIREKPNCVIGLATGSTPIGTYKELIRMHKEEGLDFSQVRTFNLDEYLGVGMDLNKPYDQDQSYARFMYEEFFKHINIPKENALVPDGLTKDPEAYCQWYEEQIKAAGGIDIQLLGLGRDGHWGFNEPGSSLASRTRVVPLTQETLDDNYEAFYKKAGISRDDMPKFAITMGIGTILEARNAVMLVNGAHKAEIVAQAIEGPVTGQVTASAMHLYPGNLTIVLDKPAASKLQRIDHYIHVEKAMKEYGLEFKGAGE
ncbi:MAG: glucosamine-6-phosphate deaminase [Candidatus Wallacebacter cryptica]|jgi:glucosamine-6-phosphate deaminase|nr:glucosamine-6-phosphate deaminase [Bacillota bacterium]